MNLTSQPPYQRHTIRRRSKPNDKEFLAWLRTLPSAYSGKVPCVAAHYRTAANSGVGCKPLFSAIPLTDSEHKLQHQIGQYNFMPREWWETQIGKYLEMFNSR